MRIVFALPTQLLGCEMVKKSPWHAKDSEVYHNNSACTEGNNIEPKNIKNGDGGKRLCKRCKDLNAK